MELKRYPEMSYYSHNTAPHHNLQELQHQVRIYSNGPNFMKNKDNVLKSLGKWLQYSGQISPQQVSGGSSQNS
jgi:hypothetical protein